jgi:3-oxoacyl-[acyl-carrier-protein] synthase-3
MKLISKRTFFDITQVPLSIDRYGNTSVASIPLTLADTYSGKADGKKRAILCGYGVGLSWGLVDCIIDTEKIGNIVECDEYFTDRLL